MSHEDHKLFDAMFDSIQRTADDLLASMHEKVRTPDVKRKELELGLVKLVQQYQREGLNIDWISIELGSGVDARVTLCPDPVENLAV
ncbi:hypothetical protein AYB08_RS20220 [Acinetobacter baumannii]|nr:hypothetical protein [Acinetobacter baumannii]EHU3218114.1 hypothetical protein [Acinetobacter baumannii]